MGFPKRMACLALAIGASCAGALAQSSDIADTIVVFDGSGSMWGQINGKAKIEIARNTLSTVLTEIPGQARIGMIAYGHRQKGVCSDIETVVQVGPANQSVPRMIDVANALKPKGKTPLSDAVRIAAEELKFTENAATVILVTDGIETCDADPCALGRELEAAGIGFTAHVVGFGLSEEEGRQVQCLADNTGGLYLAANDADELGDALRKTVTPQPIEPNPEDFDDPIVETRNVRFIFRDTAASEQIGIRQLTGTLERADGTTVNADAFAFAYPEANGNSATALLEPGSYTAVLRRDGGNRGGYDVRYSFDVPEGQDDHVIDASLSGALTINPFINPDMPYDPDNPPKGSVKSTGWAYFSVFAVVDGKVAEEPVVSDAYNNLTFPLPAGTYVVRGNLDRTITAEKGVVVNGETELDFSFDATRVFIKAVETSGALVKRQTTYWYDEPPSGRNYWRGGYGVSDGEATPFYLPTGTWITDVGGEGYGGRRSQVVVEVPGDFADIRMEVGESEEMDDFQKRFFDTLAYSGCLDIVSVKYSGCIVDRVDVEAIQ
ncbi:MAG: VWA domain-containing protein [Pseudomonadota bacterium]